MCSHVPNRGEQMVRHYGLYSNVAQGRRKKRDNDKFIPSILEPVEDPDFSGGNPLMSTSEIGLVLSKKFTR